MVLGIDIDDTITKTSENANRILNRHYPDFKEDYHNLEKEKFYEFLNTYMPEIVITNELKEGVKEALDYFHYKGYEIILITARNDVWTKNVKENTLKHLKDNKVYYDKIFFDDENIGLKGKIAKDNNVDVFIDDKESVLDEVSKYGIKCLRFTTDKSKYPTFNNWQDLVQYLERS